MGHQAVPFESLPVKENMIKTVKSKIGDCLSFETVGEFIRSTENVRNKLIVVLTNTDEFEKIINAFSALYPVFNPVGKDEDTYALSLAGIFETTDPTVPLIIAIPKEEIDTSKQRELVRAAFETYCFDNGTFIRPVVLISELYEVAKTSTSYTDSQERYTIPSIVIFLSAVCLEPLNDAYYIRRISHSVNIQRPWTKFDEIMKDHK